MKNFLAGVSAGFYYTNVAFIFDLLKVRAQENKNHRLSYIKEIRRIYWLEGMQGFMRGYQAMLLRDAPGFGVYFCSFEFFKRTFGVSDRDREAGFGGMSER